MERFDAYMERCLYGSDGFYSSHGAAGRRRGDFITSPEVGPLFATVLARMVEQWWQEAGSPEPFTVIDAGCGPGTLLLGLKRATADRPGRRLLGVDRAPSPEAVDSLSRAGIEVVTKLPDDLSGAVVIGNEILDNIPTRILVAGGEPGRWGEVHVEMDPTGRPEEVVVPVDDGQADVLPVGRRVGMAPGTRVPWHEQAALWVEDVLARGPVALWLFDYGAPTTAELAERGGWLRTYRSHERGSDPYQEPGRWDLTVDIGFDQLPPADHLGRQHEMLRAAGIDELVEEAKQYWRANAHAPDLQAMMMRSRVSEAEALLEPSGLGNWMTAIWFPHSGTPAEIRHQGVHSASTKR